ncbi:MAG: CFI-box-CTERM domain-containing protein [Terriglobia bacterium]
MSSGSGTLSMNLGGVNLSYDLGPSVDTVFNQGLSFLNSRFNADQAFTGGTIIGANSLVQGLVSPLLQGATNQLNENATEIPTLYGAMETNNYNIGMAAINTEAAVAESSIASSNASASAASSAGGCFITTAVCETFGMPDDCYTLRMLREFRDSYLMRTNVGRSFVMEYYATARKLCAKIRERADMEEYMRLLYTRFILPALLAIEHRTPDRAFKIYRQMIYSVRAENP